MLHSSKNFQELVKQTKALQEDEKGQLKGGFASFSLEEWNEPPTVINSCTNLNCGATCSSQQSSSGSSDSIILKY